jgi:hypothetical protein
MTLTDLRYQQVLNNLAMVAKDPAMLPYYVVITDGTASVTDTGTANNNLTWGFTGGPSRASSNSEMLGLMGSRAISENWTLGPLHDPDRLEAMRCVYQWVLGMPAENSGDCGEKIHHFRLENELAKMPQGWFRVGGAHEVPKDACYVGRYCHTYVWVTPGGIEGLTRLSLIMLDIATIDLASLSPIKSVVRKYDEKCQFKGVEVTEIVDAETPDCMVPGAKAAGGRPPLPKMRREFRPTLRGLFVLPRP